MELSSRLFIETRERLRVRFGEETVTAWWECLPQTLDTLASRWSLMMEDPVGRGNTSVVIRCRQADGRRGILKVTPEPEMTRAEAKALRSWGPSGRVPEVWGSDAALGAVLLEAIPNEVPLADQRATVNLDEIAQLIARLHRNGEPTIGDGVVSLADRVEFMFDHWNRQYGHTAAPIVSMEHVVRGYELARALLQSQDAPVLLHGDLHPYNVLDGGEKRGLIAIDPRACVGDPAFDAVDWVFWPKNEPENWKPRCIELAEAIEVDQDRIWDWCRIFAPMLAVSTAARGNDPSRVDALLELAP